MTSAFCCTGCRRDFDWTGALRMVGYYNVKTIGSRYCVDCIDKEAAALGIPREQVIALRRKQGQAVP